MLVKYRMINKNMSIPRRDPEEYFCGHNEESFEENYEDMISSYLSQRHIYSASLPLPATTDSIMDQILSEKGFIKIQSSPAASTKNHFFAKNS